MNTIDYNKLSEIEHTLLQLVDIYANFKKKDFIKQKLITTTQFDNDQETGFRIQHKNILIAYIFLTQTLPFDTTTVEPCYEIAISAINNQGIDILVQGGFLEKKTKSIWNFPDFKVSFIHYDGERINKKKVSDILERNNICESIYLIERLAQTTSHHASEREGQYKLNLS